MRKFPSLQHAWLLFNHFFGVEHEMDTSSDHRFARYADDMVILVKSERAAQRVMGSIT